MSAIPYPEVTAHLRKVAGRGTSTKAELKGALYTAIVRLEGAESQLRLLAPLGDAIKALVAGEE